MEHPPDLREALDVAEALHRTLRCAKTIQRQSNEQVRALAQVRDDRSMTNAEKRAAIETIAADLRRQTHTAAQRTNQVLKALNPAQPKEAQHGNTHSRSNAA